MWKTTFTVGARGSEISFKVKLKRGIFQGDSLSPLLFCLAITPVSAALQGSSGYYNNSMKQTLTQFFFVDELKVYADSETALKRTLKIVKESSQAVGMALGLRKCGTVHMRKGRVERSEEESETQYPELDSEGHYKYLGIEQLFTTKTKKIRTRLRNKYCERLRRTIAS